jgi:hypothetical protein
MKDMKAMTIMKEVLGSFRVRKVRKLPEDACGESA